MIRKLALTAVLFAAVSACSPEGGETVRLYYVSNDANSLVEYIHSDKAFSHPADIVNELAKAPREARLRTVISGVVCNGVFFQDGVAYIDLSAGYDELGEHEKTLANACVVLTMSQFYGTENFRIAVDGGESSVVLHVRDFMFTDEVGTPKVLTVTLYQLDVQNRELTGERRRIVLREGQTEQRCLFDELRKTAILPARTRLLSSEIDNGILTLDMSEEFLSPPQNETQWLMIQGIARSFTELDGVDGVILAVEGQILSEYHGVELPEVLTREF